MLNYRSMSIGKQLKLLDNKFNNLSKEVEKQIGTSLVSSGKTIRHEIAKQIATNKKIQIKLVLQRSNIWVSKERRQRVFVSLKDGNIDNFTGFKRTSVGVQFNGVVYPHSFIAKLGHKVYEGVYIRLEKSRYPIKRVKLWAVIDIEEAIASLGTRGYFKRVFEEKLGFLV